MVHDVCADKHLLKINTDRFPEACHVDNCTVCVSLHLVPHTSLSCVNLPCPEKIYSGVEEWRSPPIKRSTMYSHAACGIPAVGPSPELIRYLQNTGLTCAYDKRALTSFHRARISSLLPYPLCESYVPIAHPFDPWGYVRLLDKFLHELLGYQLCFRGRDCFCNPEHIFEEAL
jgi:hypothetical protein